MANLLYKIIERVFEFAKFSNTRVVNKDLGQFKNEILISNNYRPVFFLSTGRTGTLLFTKILNKCKNIKTFHSPSPELIGQGKYAYEIYAKRELSFDENTNHLLAQVFITAREEILYKTYLHGFRYIETNNRISFFAPAIKYLIPNAKFVYVYRHPGEFIRSGIRRNWYSGNHPHDHGRIVPTKISPHFSSWDDYNLIQKISWLWDESNNFIEKFLHSISSDDYIKINFNELNTAVIHNLMCFLNIDLDDSVIQKLIARPVNIQKKGSFQKYEQWPEDDIKIVKDICGDLSAKYGYNL
ncbi:hypothetical protein ACFLS9_07485 [Bacteroidota bacterium]